MTSALFLFLAIFLTNLFAASSEPLFIFFVFLEKVLKKVFFVKEEVVDAKIRVLYSD